MLSKKILKALNEQITKELYSSYLYLQMAAWFDHNTLPGFANWMKVQAQEETAHAMIFYNYVSERGGLIDLGAIDKPTSGYKTAKDIFAKTCEHESLVTSSINNIMSLAIEEKDYATKARLDWFISEQVEEEANAAELLGKITRIGEEGNAIFMLDKDLATRVFVTPAPLMPGA
jgi:ferritin